MHGRRAVLRTYAMRWYVLYSPPPIPSLVPVRQTCWAVDPFLRGRGRCCTVRHTTGAAYSPPTPYTTHTSPTHTTPHSSRLHVCGPSTEC